MGSVTENKSPLLSVIIPVYNVERYLAQCLDSVISQSLENIEIICINDGSTDSSEDILREYAKRDSRIRIISQDNKGISETRNVGIREAAGKYVFFMDSDDIINHNAFELCVNDMEKRELEYLCFNVIGFGEEIDKIKRAGDLNRTYYKRYLNEEKIYSGIELFHELAGRKALVVTTWSCILLKSAIIEHDLFFHRGILHEDESWTFTVLMSLSRCGCLNKTLYQNRIRENSITQSSLSFDHVYGLFAGTSDIRKYIAAHPECFDNDENGKPEIERALYLQRRAIAKYQKIDEEEKLRRELLEPEERALFEQMIAYPSKLKNKEEKRYKENAKLKEKVKAQKDEIDKLKKKNKALNKKNKALAKQNSSLKKIKKSKSYRIGRMLTLPLRKLKSLLKKLRESKNPAENIYEPSVFETIPVCENTAVINKEINPNTVWLLGTPEHKNMGDQFIAQEQVNFIRAALPDAEIIEYTDYDLRRQKFAQLDEIEPSQLVCLHGGGNIGNLWAGHEAFRERVITHCKSNPIIIFPQSIYYSDDKEGQKALNRAKGFYCGSNLTLFCRDKVSFDFAKENFDCRSILVPDIVMWRSQKPEHSIERYGVLTLLRRDVERRLTDEEEAQIENVLASGFSSIEEFDMLIKSKKITQVNRKEKTDMMLSIVSSAECVVTDRLHGMVLCAITETPCVVFSNGYHKVEGCYEWIKELGYISFISDINELDSAISRVMNCPDKTYPESEIRRSFAPLNEALHQSVGF